MPSKKQAAKRSKAFKKCSRQRRPGCSRKKQCSWDGRRSPSCQPKRKTTRRKATGRKRSRTKRTSQSNAMLTEGEFNLFKKDIDCFSANNDGTCKDGCDYNPLLGRCAAAMVPKFMQGSKYITFRSKKPSFSFRIPITVDTICGKYAGPIRFDPRSGKLVLCYGPTTVNPNVEEPKSASIEQTQPILGLLLKPKLQEQMLKWHYEAGNSILQRRMMQSRKRYYAEDYGLPGATYQLTYTEVKELEYFLAKNGGSAEDSASVKTLKELACAPTAIPLGALPAMTAPSHIMVPLHPNFPPMVPGFEDCNDGSGSDGASEILDS